MRNIFLQSLTWIIFVIFKVSDLNKIDIHKELECCTDSSVHKQTFSWVPEVSLLSFNTEGMSEIVDIIEWLSYGVGEDILLSYDEIEGVNPRRPYFWFTRLLYRRLKKKLLYLNKIFEKEAQSVFIPKIVHSLWITPAEISK